MSRRPISLPPSPAEISEGNSSSSRFVQRLISEPNSASQPACRPTAPRILVQFWDDVSAVPGDVQSCLDSWTPLEEAGFKRTLFDDTSARCFIGRHFSPRHVRAFDRCIHPAMRADYFRLCFMLAVGGLYVDADDEYQGTDIEPLTGGCRLQLQALCYDLASDSMIDASDAVTETVATDRVFYVNNNPLVTGPEHPVIARALERSTTLLLATSESNRDIQSLTGPGNLTASLVAHAIAQDADGEGRDFELLMGWDAVAVSKWPLDYRADARNWRIWARGENADHS